MTAQQAAATPFFGMGGRYNRSRDPWTLFDQQTPNPVRDYLRYFYGQTLNYASSRVSCRKFFFFFKLFFGFLGGGLSLSLFSHVTFFLSVVSFSKKKSPRTGPLRGLRVPRRRNLHLERRLVGHPGHLSREHRRGRR